MLYDCRTDVKQRRLRAFVDQALPQQPPVVGKEQ